VEPAADITLAEIEADPYAVFERLRGQAPVAWIEPLGMWWAVRHADVQEILADPEAFTTRFEASTIYKAFGVHMLTSEGDQQERFKAPFRSAFSPTAVRAAFEPAVRDMAASLVSGIAEQGQADLRAELAGRLPVLAILAVFGMPASAETELRVWYDSFERALANFTGDVQVAATAEFNVVLFHRRLQAQIDAVRGRQASDLLSRVVNPVNGELLSDEEIKRNAAIIFFGGISTVEALILNTLYALGSHPDAMAAVRADRSRVGPAIEEAARWLSPVQSATRHVVRDMRIGGVSLRAGDTINCMLGAANRDPAVFAEPDRFWPDRPDLRKHIAFASGPHFCLGSHLARLEARVAIETLLTLCPDLRIDTDVGIEGYEFRQPKRLQATWRAQ
jgi:cytochrome P450